MKPFSFVHAADLHLGTPFSGLAECSPEWGKRLAEAPFRAFNRIIELCLERQVDFLLLAGDIYDSSQPDLRAQVCLRDGLARLATADIPTYIASGNHDYSNALASHLHWPDGVHFFPPGQVATYSVLKDGITIADVSGVSYPSQNPTQNFVPLFAKVGDAPFKIGVLHTNVGAEADYANYAPCTLSDLRLARMDYWALGHVHRAAVLNPSRPTILYPGTSQGRSARETGPKGCYYVKIEQTGVWPVFVPTAEVLWAELEYDISTWEQLDMLFTKLDEQLIQGAGEADYLVVRLSLIGRGALHHELLSSEIQNQASEALRSRSYPGWRGVWFDQIRVATGPPVDKETERGSGTLTGDFLDILDRLTTDLTNGNDSPLIQGLLDEIRTLEAKNRRYLSPFTRQQLLTCLAKGADLGLDLLTREEE